MASYDRNRRQRENFRISGPGMMPVGTIERAQNTAIDTMFWLMKGPMRAASYLVLAGIALVGSGWTKGKLSNGFNSSAQNMSIAGSMPETITQQTNIAPPAIPVPPAPVVTTPAPVHTTPAPVVTMPEPAVTPAPIVTPAQPPKSASNLKDGPLWDKPPQPLKGTWQGLASTASQALDVIADIIPKPQPAWTNRQVMAKIDVHTTNDPISAELVKKIMAVESSGNIYAKSKTGARGLFQFLPQTQLEYMYKSSDFLPAPYSALAKKYITPNENGIGYRIKEDTPRSIRRKIMDAIYDPDVSIILAREHLRYRLMAVDQNFRAQLASEVRYLKTLHNAKTTHKGRIAEMERHLARPLTSADAEWAHMIGDGNATSLIAAYADPLKRKHKAVDYISQTAWRANSYMFEGLSVEQSRARVVEKVGDTPLPRDLSRPGGTAIAKNTASASDWQPS